MTGRYGQNAEVLPRFPAMVAGAGRCFAEGDEASLSKQRGEGRSAKNALGNLNREREGNRCKGFSTTSPTARAGARAIPPREGGVGAGWHSSKAAGWREGCLIEAV